MDKHRDPETGENESGIDQSDPELAAKAQKVNKFARGCFIGFITLFIIAWIGGISYFVKEANDAKDAENWPTTQGEVLETRITSHTSTDSSSRSGSGGSNTTYKPRVLYRYSVEGETLENHIVQMMTSYDSRAEAQEVLDRYPIGSTVSVYYKEEEPSKSLLEPGLSAESQLVITIFTYVPFGLLFIVALFWGIKKMKSSF